MSRHLVEGSAALFLWPLYALRNFIIFTQNEAPGWQVKVQTFATFLPVLAISTLVWAAAWAVGLWLAGLL
jgi:hypothetical protein